MQHILFRTLLAGGGTLGLAVSAYAQNGACYLPNSTCSQVTAAACATAGGVFGGVGVACPPYQVNGAGATLFADFATNAALTNDFINIDYDFGADFISGAPVALRDIWNLNDGNGPQADQCGPPSPGSAAPNQVWWIHQYRSVGSVEGYEEFINFQLCGDIPENLTSERGSLNSLLFSGAGVPNGAAAAAGWGNPPGSACTLDLDPAQADGPNASNSPVCPTGIDYANVDVPGLWATRSIIPAPPGDVIWDRRPGEPGYGTNPRLSYYDPDISLPTNPGNPDGDRTAKLASLDPTDYGCVGIPLNFNLDAPDANTLYDTAIAWSPVSINCNRGVAADWNRDGVEDGVIRYTELQHGYVTGRMPSGENLAFACRDIGSGTRNDAMNSLGIDPSYANGDNDGPRVNSPPNVAGLAEFLTRPGPGHQVANSAGSSVVESATQNRRLAIGYTGVFGSSRTQGDTRAGRYEAMAVVKDVVGGAQPAGTTPVFPTLDAILDNCDPDTGFQIGAIQTLITRGNPRAHDFGPFAPVREPGDPLMSNVEAAKFVRNIEESIAEPVGVPPRIMPGQFIALSSSVVKSIDCISNVNDPLDFSVGNAFGLDVALQTYVRNNNTLRAGNQPIPPYGDVDAGGTIRPAGMVPQRRAPAQAVTEPLAAGNGVANTSAEGDDVQVVTVGAPVTPGQVIITPGPNGVLNTTPDADDVARDALSYRDGGDATSAGYRYWDGAAFQTIGTTASQALSRRNAVQGDLNNDGRRDIHDTAKLVEAYHRMWGFSGETVDQVLQNFEPIISNNANDNGSMTVNRLILHVAADFDGDGEFDVRDLRYWADGLALYAFNHPTRPRELDRRNGFVQVDTQWALRSGAANSTPFGPITLATGTYHAGDARGDVAGSPYIQPGGTPRGYDGRIDCIDIAYVEANFVADWSNTNLASGRDLSCDMDGDLDVDCDDVAEIVVGILDSTAGDFNLDGVVDQADCDIVTANLGQPGGYCAGDLNCDGQITAADYPGPCGSACPGPNGDANCDGSVDFFDIDPFLLALFNPPQYQATFCGGDTCAVDTDDSGLVDFFDIDPFLNCLFSGCP